MQAIITGRIGADAEKKTFNGRDYLRIPVADRQRDGSTIWATIFGHYSEKMAEVLRKGATVTVIGNLTASTYTAKDGSQRVDLTIWANDITIAAFADDYKAMKGYNIDDDLPI